MRLDGVAKRYGFGQPWVVRDVSLEIRPGGLTRVEGRNGDELEKRIDACLDRLGGLEYADVPLRTMSKGMCQKVAVAQALLSKSGLLVLDEAWTRGYFDTLDGDLVFVRVAADVSDSVLRRLLGVGDDVHIRTVGRESVDGGQL